MCAAERSRGSHGASWLAAAVALLAVVIGAGAWYALRVLQGFPAEMAAQGRSVAREVGDLARSFRTGTMTRRFAAFNRRVIGTNHLQVATLQEMDVFELEDRASVLWGTVDLPAVVIRATFPVDDVYFVDLQAPWRFELRDHRLLVLAPALHFNKPAVDVSRLRWQVVRGSLFRDEQAVQARLQREITGRTAIQASANIPRVRETSRQQVARFVTNWLLQTFADGKSYRVEVYFADELPAWQRAEAL